MTSLPARTLRSSKRRKPTSIVPVYRNLSSLSSSSSSSSSNFENDSDFVLQSDTRRPSSSRSTNASREPQGAPLSPVRKRKGVNLKPNLDLVIRPGAPSAFTESDLRSFQHSILNWYAANHRVFPWRCPPRYRPEGSPRPAVIPENDTSPGAPYAIWVSEVMSQQTRIEVVVDYYKRWMTAFPSVHHLATASLDRVNELWAGLGYYRRARFLHEGAKYIVDNLDGVIPSDVNSLMAIKGIGRYTAGAIASIAFGKSVPCVDGNVERVLCRLRPGVDTGNHREKLVWKLAEDCVSQVECPSDFNQAVMELGATVCKPRAMRCDICPVRSVCGAYAAALELGVEDTAAYVARYPLKTGKKGVKVRNEAVVVLVACAYVDGAFKTLLVQREGHGLLAGLWEALNFVYDEGVVVNAQDRDEERGLIEQLKGLLGYGDSADGGIGTIADAGSLVHAFSHIRQTLHVKVVVVTDEVCRDGAIMENGVTVEGKRFRWISCNGLASAAVSTQMRKVFSRAFLHVRNCETNIETAIK